MQTLFTDNSSAYRLPLDNADVIYYPDFFDLKSATDHFNELLSQTPWQQDHITIYGKTYAQPRLTALYGNNGKSYSYSNITMQPHNFTPLLKHIKSRVENHVDENFTTCLLNLYRHGQDSNGWHADDEPELGKNPTIASLSFGASRFFKFRRKANKKETYKLNLTSGSLLIMRGATQHNWQHELPKTKKDIGARINLTFRVII